MTSHGGMAGGKELDVAGSPDESTRSKYSAPAAASAARVLLTLARQGEALSLAELARRSGGSKSLTFRVVRELEAVNLVTASGGPGYQLGPAVLEFADAVRRVSRSEQLAEILSDLSADTGQAINVGVLRGFDIVVVARHQPEQALVSFTYIGARMPANCTALGKVLLANLEDDVLAARIPPRMQSLTSKSVLDRDQLIAEMGAIREQGWAVDLEGSILGRFAVAVPVRQAVAGELAAVAVSASMDDYSEANVNRIVAALTRAARRMERLIVPIGASN